MQRQLLFATAATLVAAPSLACAQASAPTGDAETPAQNLHEQPTVLDPVFVTGARHPRQVALAEAAARLQRRAGGTNLIPAEEFTNGRATSISDIMAYAPGIVARTRHGEESRLSIRGSGIQRGFLMRGVQLYQDGVPMNLADGAGDYQAIDPLAIQQVEVWRGANALEYGSTTLGGAVNFVTPTGRTADRVRLRLDAGAFGQRRTHATAAGATDSLDGVLSVTRNRQGGWREHSAVASSRVTGSLGYRLSDSLEGRLYLAYVDTAAELPGSISRAAMATDPRQAAPNSARQNAGNSYLLKRAAARLTWRVAEGRQLSAAAYVSDRDRFHPMVFGILDQQSEDAGADIRGVFELGGAGPTRRLVLGAAIARYSGAESRFANMGGSPGARTGLQELQAVLQTLYGEYSHGLSRSLTVQAGAQLVRTTRELTNVLDPAGSYDRTFESFSPKLAVTWQAAPADQLFANVSRSFEPAPFGEAAIRPLLPHPYPQKATTLEVGWRRSAGEVRLEAVAYRSWVRNELLALTDSTGTSIGTANAGRTIHQGLEVGVRLPLTGSLDLRAVYLLNDFYFDGDPYYGDNRIAGVAEHLLNAELEWRPTPWLAVSPSIEWQASGVWIDHANTVKSKGYALSHLRLHGELTRHVGWYADLRNVFDHDHVASTAVQANVRGADGAYYFPGDPRSVYIGLQFRY